jgi:hypothetical protein
MATLKYDFNDILTKGVRDILKQSYQRVDISSTPDRNNDLYAILKAEVKAPTSYTPNDVTLGLSSTAQLDVYETSTGKKLDTYYANKSSEYHRPAALNGYLIVTMLSAFTLTPVTMPLAVDVAGKYVSSIVNDNLKGLLSNLATEVMAGSITIKDEPQSQRGASSQGGSVIESLLIR